MGGWQKCDGGIGWKDESSGIEVILSYDGESCRMLRRDYPKLQEVCEAEGIDIADAIVFEWREVWVQVKGGDVKELLFGNDKTIKRHDEWRYTFRNYLGKSRITLLVKDGREIITDPIEVVSPKTSLDNPNSPLFYPKFLRNLVDDLIRQLVSLPFDLSAPTEFATEERIQPPALIFVLHILAQKADEIRFALQTVLRNPHRRLVTEERWVRLDEVSSVDADTVLMMLQHPEYLHPYRGNTLTALARRLKSKVPEKVFERRVTETLDTPENRFIKRFMDIVLFWCDELERRDQDFWQRAANYAPQLNRLRDFVRFARADPLFADVGEMAIFPASSQVLLKRDGYRECLQIYRLLHIAHAPIFDRIQDAIDNRRIDQLYEFWCFFKLAEELSGGEKPEIKPPLQADVEGLPHGLEAHLPDGSVLVYNKTFKHGNGSYSVPMRPDFSLFCNDKNKPCIVFDAKFRFEEKDLEGASPDAPSSNGGSGEPSSESPKSIDEALETAIQKGDIERLAKHADICKMHTYRDALQCRAAVVLYPGTKSVFFRTDSKREDNATINQIVRGDNWYGVGAIPLVPKCEQSEI